MGGERGGGGEAEVWRWWKGRVEGWGEAALVDVDDACQPGCRVRGGGVVE
jgi:hypothetical protein